MSRLFAKIFIFALFLLKKKREKVKKILFFLYQWIIFCTAVYPALTLITALLVMVLAPTFFSEIASGVYYPPKWWSRFIPAGWALCRIQSKGHENLDPHTAPIFFVANHQGALIFS